jgi:transposase
MSTMMTNRNLQNRSAEKTVRDIRRATRRKFSSEEKIRIVLEGLRGEDSIAELCRREGIHSNLYYRWSKEFLEAGKKRLVEIETGQGMTTAQACKKLGFTEQSYYRWRKEYGGLQISQAKRLEELEKENARLKKLVPDLSLDKDILNEALKGNYCV